MLKRVSFEVAGENYVCVFANSAMAAYEEKYDESFFAVVEKLDGKNLSSMRVTFLMDLMRFAVQAGQPDMSEAEVAALVDEILPADMITLVAEAIAAAFPQGEGGAEVGSVQGKTKPARQKQK